MNTLEYIRKEFAWLRRQTNATVAGIDDEQLNWAPPGLANSISVTLLHTIGSEDFFIQERLQGKAQVWDSQGWAEKIGVSCPPGGGKGWDETRQATLKLAVVMAYEEAVCTATSAYLDALQEADLERKIMLFGHEQTEADALLLVLSHATGHIGEIAALKGVQGLQGLPF